MIDKELAEEEFEPYRELLIRRRKELGMTLGQVARAMGLRRPYQVEAWELGLRIPTLMWLSRWCRALRCNLTIRPWEK